LERRIFNRVIQLGLDPNDEAICELLRRGHPAFAALFDPIGDQEDEGEGGTRGFDDMSSEREGSSSPHEGQQSDDRDESGPPPQYEFNYNKWS